MIASGPAGPSDPIAFLFGLERLGMKFGLETTTALCARLQHPERAFRSIIVAGTNGKGSVTAMTATALTAAGHRCGRYTSPHLRRLEERFVVDGREIDAASLREVAGVIQGAVLAMIDEGQLTALPTFFECATVMAFEYFRRAGAAVAVLEVGLGGRLDATNVVSPLAAAIVSLALDHQAQLGSDLASIAREKAGVIKAGIPVVCGPLPDEAAAVVAEVCAVRGARLVRAPDAVVTRARLDHGDTRLDLRSPRHEFRDLRLGLRGRHQVDNAAVAVLLLEELAGLGLPVPGEAIEAGLTQVDWPGRIERRRRHGTDVLLDAAHNPAGAAALARYLVEAGWQGATLVFGALADKDVPGNLAALLPACGDVVCTTADSPRALAAEALGRLVTTCDPARTVAVIDDPATALDAACAASSRVVAAGSIFLVGPLRDILRDS